MKRHHLIVIIALANCMACKQHYEPRVLSAEQSLLVVEANLDPGNDTTIIRLTRTLKLSDTAKTKPETKAILTVEGRDNSTRSFVAWGNGFYMNPGLNLTIGNEYRLRIKTNDGNEYVSGYEKTKVSPPIDSVSWDMTADDTALHFFVTTHDPAKNTRYYRWSFDETWEIRTSFRSYLIYVNGTPRPRIFPQEDIQYCWKYDSSKVVTIANSVQLDQDIIYKLPIHYIPRDQEKLSVRYSLLVRQYALDKESYLFYELLKKNTEDMGSLFSPQPSRTQGNIRSVKDTTEEVIGYVTASTVSKKRIFISTNQVPLWRFFLDRYCTDAEYRLNSPHLLRDYFGQLGYTPSKYDSPDPEFGAQLICVDCRVRGGINKQPPYW